MKKLLVLGVLFTVNAWSSERILINDSKETEVELSTASVRCSMIGYGTPELKVNIPALDGWTLFDHSNINAGDIPGEPCMTAGSCKFFPSDTGPTIDTILAGSRRVETIVVRRQIVEVKNVVKNEEDQNTEQCSRHIEERLETDVFRGDRRGKIKFTHTRSGMFETFPLSVCLKIKREEGLAPAR